MYTVDEIRSIVSPIAARYGVDRLYLFGSYARGDATEESDIDVVVIGGAHFNRPDIFAFAEDLRELTGKDVDAFEICEVNVGTPFYETLMREGKQIA